MQEKYDSSDFESVLGYIANRFGSKEVFSNQVRCVSLVYDLAPQLDSERKTLSELFECGFVGSMVEVIESDDETKLVTFYDGQENFINQSGMDRNWCINITNTLARILQWPTATGIIDKLMDDAKKLQEESQFDLAYEKYCLAGKMGCVEAKVQSCKLVLDGNVEIKDSGIVKTLKEAALANSGLAQYLLFVLHNSGNMVAKDERQAMYYLKKSAKNGVPEAQYEYAFELMRGNSVEQDRNLAEDYFRRAVEQGYKVAYGGLGLLYELTGREESAKESYRQGAEAGYFYCMRKYAEMLLQSSATSDRKKAFDLLTRASKDRTPETLYLLGVCHENGYGCNINIEEARALYREAAEADIPEAQYAYGRICMKNDEEEIREHGVQLMLAAAKNDNEAAIEIACSYLFENMEGNEKLLHSMLEKGRRYKIPVAFRYSGILYCRGLSVDKDTAKGLDYLRRAFAEGDTDSQQFLNEFSVEQKEEKPKGFFKKLFKNK